MKGNTSLARLHAVRSQQFDLNPASASESVCDEYPVITGSFAQAALSGRGKPTWLSERFTLRPNAVVTGALVAWLGDSASGSDSLSRSELSFPEPEQLAEVSRLQWLVCGRLWGKSSNGHWD